MDLGIVPLQNAATSDPLLDKSHIDPINPTLCESLVCSNTYNLEQCALHPMV